MQRALIRASFLLVLTGLAASCSNGTTTSDTLTQPTSLSTEMSASFSAESPMVFAQIATQPGPSCATHVPFTVPIGLIVRANRNLRVFVTTINMRFRDSFNIVMPQVTLPAPMLTRQFGTNLVEARSARTFPLTLPVGCGTGRQGTVTVTIDTQDEQGRRESGQISVAVH